MKVKLAYGKEGLSVLLPDRNVTVLEPKYIPGLPDQKEALRSSLRAPAAVIARTRQSPEHSAGPISS